MSVHAIRILAPSTEADFARYFDLRWRVLRAPWNQPPGSERDGLEDQSWHLMACADDGTPVGVARLHLTSNEQAQIRYMAVDAQWRNRGIGSALIVALEARACELGVREIVLAAREASVPFYLRSGYEVTGSGHVLFGTIRHTLMRKRLGGDHSDTRAP